MLSDLSHATQIKSGSAEEEVTSAKQVLLAGLDASLSRKTASAIFLQPQRIELCNTSATLVGGIGTWMPIPTKTAHNQGVVRRMDARQPKFGSPYSQAL